MNGQPATTCCMAGEEPNPARAASARSTDRAKQATAVAFCRRAAILSQRKTGRDIRNLGDLGRRRFFIHE
jgi:hypothetical protein